MPWVRIDEEFPRHPKVVKAGPLGMAMHVAALCYCNQYLTDGFVPRGVAAGLLDLSGIGMRQWMGELVGGGVDATWELVVEDLEKAGLWEQVEGGWEIHDYHDYQPTREHVLKLRETRKAVGSKGGKASGEARRNQPRSNLLSNEEASSPATSEANDEPKTNPGPVPVPPVLTTGSTSAITAVGTTGVEQARPIDDVVLVFQTWQASTGKQRAKLDGNRRYAIQAALDRYDVEDVLAAVQGWVNDPWPERAQQNDIVQLLWMGTRRKPQNVLEKMRDLWRDGPPPVMGKHTSEMARIARDMTRRGMARGEVVNSDLGRMDRGGALDQRQLPRPEDRTGDR